jgi:hypothetical protein
MAMFFSCASAMANRGIGIPRHLRLPSGVQAAQKLFHTRTVGPYFATQDVPLLIGDLIWTLGLHARLRDSDYALLALRWCLSALRLLLLSVLVPVSVLRCRRVNALLARDRLAMRQPSALTFR